MHKLIFLLLFIVCASCKAQQQKTFGDILYSLYPNKELKEESVKVTQVEDTLTITDKAGGNTVLLYLDTRERPKYIAKVNNQFIDTILPGNNDYWGGGLGRPIIDEESVDLLRYNGHVYYVVSMYYEGCNGTFCRAFHCLLISVTDSKIYYFRNEELAPGQYFRIDEKGDMVYLDIDGFYSYTEGSGNDDKSTDTMGFYNTIKLMTFNKAESEWMRDERGRSITVMLPDRFESDSCKVIEWKW